MATAYHTATPATHVPNGARGDDGFQAETFHTPYFRISVRCPYCGNDVDHTIPIDGRAFWPPAILCCDDSPEQTGCDRYFVGWPRHASVHIESGARSQVHAEVLTIELPDDDRPDPNPDA